MVSSRLVSLLLILCHCEWTHEHPIQRIALCNFQGAITQNLSSGPLNIRGSLQGMTFNPVFSFPFLVLVVLGLRCDAQAFSSCNDQGPLFVPVGGLLIALASLVAEHRL